MMRGMPFHSTAIELSRASTSLSWRVSSRGMPMNNSPSFVAIPVRNVESAVRRAWVSSLRWAGAAVDASMWNNVASGLYSSAIRHPLLILHSVFV